MGRAAGQASDDESRGLLAESERPESKRALRRRGGDGKWRGVPVEGVRAPGRTPGAARERSGGSQLRERRESVGGGPGRDGPPRRLETKKQ